MRPVNEFSLRDGEIYYGEHLIESRQFPLKSAKDSLLVLSRTGIAYANKESFADFNEKYGTTAAVFKKAYNKFFYQTHIADKAKWVNRFCFGHKGLRPALLTRLEQVTPLLEQYKADGLDHLTPLAFQYEKTPQEFKKKLGKSAWKKLCKNSMTRNNLLVKIMRFNIGAPEDLSLLNEFPSKLLKRGGNSPVSFTHAGLWASQQVKVFSGLREAGYILEHLYRDTQRLAHRTDNIFSDKWSREQMQARHDAYTQVYNTSLRIESEKVYDTLEKTTVRTGNIGDYTYNLLMSEAGVSTEGREMHHCVGVYGSRVAKGTYLVYSVRSKENRYTLGVSVAYKDDKPVFTLNQNYRACNQSVSEEEIGVSCEIIKLLKASVAEETE